MNEQIDEQLSALMDGELERDGLRFLLRSAASDPALPQRWERYHVARQALRRQPLGALRTGFADSVMAQLADEPALRGRGMNPWLRWGAGGAIAASVALAALVATRPAPLGPGPAESAIAARAPMGASGATIAASPASATSMPMAASPDVRPPLLMPSVPLDASPASFGAEAGQTVVLDPRLQSYLVRHYQAVGGNGQSGFTPYVLLTTPQPVAETSSAGAATARKR